MKNSYKKIKLNKFILSTLMAASIFVVATPKAFASDITPENVLLLVNKERIYNGLMPLKLDPDLNRAARNKSKDMLSRNYFDHYAYGMTPWDFISSAGYKYLYAGENLAMDFHTSEGMVNAWMNSPMHRKNILSEDYEDIGIGVIKGAYTENGVEKDTIVVDNMFGRKKPIIVEVFNKVIENIQNLFSW
jgi:uncharacterized protein YkwD